MILSSLRRLMNISHEQDVYLEPHVREILDRDIDAVLESSLREEAALRREEAALRRKEEARVLGEAIQLSQKNFPPPWGPIWDTLDTFSCVPANNLQTCEGLFEYSFEHTVTIICENFYTSTTPTPTALPTPTPSAFKSSAFKSSALKSSVRKASLGLKRVSFTATPCCPASPSATARMRRRVGSPNKSSKE